MIIRHLYDRMEWWVFRVKTLFFITYAVLDVNEGWNFSQTVPNNIKAGFRVRTAICCTAKNCTAKSWQYEHPYYTVFCCVATSWAKYEHHTAQFFAVQNGGALAGRKKLLRLIYWKFEAWTERKDGRLYKEVKECTGIKISCFQLFSDVSVITKYIRM